jgi:hypothetical protein
MRYRTDDLHHVRRFNGWILLAVVLSVLGVLAVLYWALWQVGP